MKLGHLHFGFRDLQAAVAWMEQVLELRPVYQNPTMATFAMGEVSFIFDQAETDTEATIAFDSEDCHVDFQRLADRRAIMLDVPKDMPWGVRAAYFRGPGKLTLELEQPLG